MSLGMVNHVSFGQQQVQQPSKAKKALKYTAIAVGTGAAIAGAVIYRKNLGTGLKVIGDAFKKYMPETSKKVAEFFSSKPAFLNNIGTKFDKVLQAVKTFGGEAWNMITAGYNWAIKNGGELVGKVVDFFRNLVAKK